MVDRELSREGDAILRQAMGEAFKNVEVEDTAGTRRLLMVRFPRVKSAVWAAVISVVTVGATVLALISSRGEGGAAVAAGLIAFVVFVGVYVVQILIISARGGFFALTPTGLLVNTGLTSIFVPWTAIGTAMVDVLDSRSRSPVLRVLLKGGSSVPGWPWTTTFLVVLFGSSRGEVRIMAWWFQPVPLDRIVETIRYLASHPEDRARIGHADPDTWLVDRSPTAGGTGKLTRFRATVSDSCLLPKAQPTRNLPTLRATAHAGVRGSAMPDLPVLLGWLLVGWYCGTPFPHFPPSPTHPPSPIHPPNPSDPVPHPPVPIGPGPWWQRWAFFGVLGAVGGVIGGYVFGLLFNIDYGAPAGVLLSLAGTFVGARLVADVGGAYLPMTARRG